MRGAIGYIGVLLIGGAIALSLATALSHAIASSFNKTAARIESQRSG